MGARVRVQRVLSPNGGAESWTVIGDDRRPVAPVEAYSAWLSAIERSPNTVRAYAQDLKAFWEFLTARELAWDRLTLEQLGLFTAWLRQPADNVVLLAGAEPRRAASTVNRMLSAVMGFYDFQARHGVAVARTLVDRSRSGRGSYKPFLDGIAPARPRGRVGRLRESRRPPRTLPPGAAASQRGSGRPRHRCANASRRCAPKTSGYERRTPTSTPSSRSPTVSSGARSVAETERTRASRGSVDSRCQAK